MDENILRNMYFWTPEGFGRGNDYADSFRASTRASLSCIDAATQSTGYTVEFHIISERKKISQAYMCIHRDTCT